MFPLVIKDPKAYPRFITRNMFRRSESNVKGQGSQSNQKAKANQIKVSALGLA